MARSGKPKDSRAASMFLSTYPATAVAMIPSVPAATKTPRAPSQLINVTPRTIAGTAAAFANV